MSLDEEIRPSDHPGLSAKVSLELVTDGPPTVADMEKLFAEARAWGIVPSRVQVESYHRNCYAVAFDVPLRGER